MMRNKITLSILYVYYNTPKEILISVRSVVKEVSDITHEIIIVDNNSPVKLPSFISKDTIKIIVNTKNLGFGKAVNQAAEIAHGEFLLILNPDTIITKGAIKKLLTKLQGNHTLGIIGPRLIDGRGEILSTAGKMPLLPMGVILFSSLKNLWPFSKLAESYTLQKKDYSREMCVDVVGGACLFLRRSVFQKVKGFDERFFMYFEEADLCYRIRKLGYKILYFPEAEITHFVGRSTDDRRWIQKIFEMSRQKFFAKYHGSLAALCSGLAIAILKKNNLLLFLIIVLSCVLNFYQIDKWIMFFGDIGRDYLAAKHMIISGSIPLVGITSSVTWLHQGPLAIYLIALSFLLGNFHPSSPSVLFALLGVATVYLVYKIGVDYFSTQVGLLSALLFATSPLVIVNVRSPYHTAPIPFVTGVVLLLLYQLFLRRSKRLYFIGFCLGLLFMLELSNTVMLFAVAVLFYIFRKQFNSREYIKVIIGFFAGITPLILYDLTNSFVQTGGFVLWTVNRVRLFFGLTLSGESTGVHPLTTATFIWDQIRRVIFPADEAIAVGFVAIMLIAVIFSLFRLKNVDEKKGSIVVVLLLIISIAGFFVHAAPGPAYFPVIFVPLSILLGLSISKISQRNPFVILLVVFFALYNAWYVLSNQYFLDTSEKKGSLAQGWNYGYGAALSEQINQVNTLISMNDDSIPMIRGGGFWETNKTSIDNYKYLFWWIGGTSSGDSQGYIFYPADDPQNKSRKAFYRDNFIFVSKNE